MTESVEILLDPGVLERVDLWRFQQLDAPSRAEALQRLVDVGLAVSSQGGGLTASNQGRGKISEGEKLILWALQDLWKHQNVDVSDGIDLAFVCEMVSGRHEWALEWKYPGLFTGSFADPPEVSEVCDVLTMWNALERSNERLSDDDRKRVEDAASSPLGKFIGFSINDEVEHYRAAKILIDRLGRFKRFKERDLNSHLPYLGVYRRMLDVFKRLSPEQQAGDLTVAELIELLEARIHPSRQSIVLRDSARIAGRS